MNIQQFQYTEKSGWLPQLPEKGDSSQLIMIFGDLKILKSQEIFNEFKNKYKNAILFGCSTSGEIFSDRVFDDTAVASVIHFEKTQLQLGSLRLSNANDSLQAGKNLAQTISHVGLKHVIVLSIGVNVNGSELTKGLREALPTGVSVTGGLAGDKDRFQETFVIANHQTGNDLVAILGFYGDHIHIGAASMGGWDSFGPERLVTKSKGNILYELDGKSALKIYKEYLGEHAKDLPGSALRFPLSLRSNNSQERLVRTILSVNEDDQSMVFAGDLPVNSYAQLMRANFDRVIEGAIGAAQGSINNTQQSPDFALLISCVGRKIILKQRIDEEIEGVRNVFGSKTKMTGFYSYGEISPFTTLSKCELHNQTMTITVISEDLKNVA